MAQPTSGQVARRKRVILALVIYALVTLAVMLAMGPERLAGHTSANHYALQAGAWLDGHLDLGGPPPRYTGNNDFALYQDQYYVSFPPVPAVLLVPVVAAAGSAEAVADGRVFALLAGLAPALLFLALELVRQLGRSARNQRHNLALALSFGLGSVYWFSAAQGTVWFAGHVVATSLACGYLLASIDARHPVVAGLCLALAVGTRPSLAFALPLFLGELRRAERRDGGRLWLKRGAAFATPLVLIGVALATYNAARFGDPLEFGHHYLTVVWRERIDRWGLFSLHYLGRNLAVMLTSLPMSAPGRGCMINGHGLALWITTPLYVYALWPRRTTGLYWAAAASALAVALVNLLYQNSGWVQFGYRFSNDFAPFLFLMIAVGDRRVRWPFWLLACWGLGINAYGAFTFGKAAYADHYFIDRTQQVLHSCFGGAG